MRIDTAAVTQLALSLVAPFDPSEVKWKPQAVNGNRALAIAYVDARVIMDRLDDSVGVHAWQDKYQILPDGNVICTLSVLMENEWISKTDVGGQSEQPDEGDRCKAAFSDALKRAAVKFGIGRYLYRLPSQWVDYNPTKRQFVSTPRLPGWALPAGSNANTSSNSSAGNGSSNGTHASKATPSSAEILADYQDRLTKVATLRELHTLGEKMGSLPLSAEQKAALRVSYKEAKDRIEDEIAERAAIQSDKSEKSEKALSPSK